MLYSSSRAAVHPPSLLAQNKIILEVMTETAELVEKIINSFAETKDQIRGASSPFGYIRQDLKETGKISRNPLAHLSSATT